MVSASSSAITRGWPNFNPGAFWPSSVTAGCTTLWMLSPLMPLLWLTRSTSSNQSLIRPKVTRVPERPLGPAAAAFFEVLLQVEILVLDVQTGMHPVLYHSGAKLSRRSLGHPPSKDQLHTVWPPQIQIVANDLFEELPPTQRAIVDLRQADLHLPDRQGPVVAGLPVLRSQRQWNPPEPFAEYPINVLRPQAVADLLQFLRLGARQEPIIQRLVGDLLLLQLPLGPLVSIQAQLHASRGVAGDFDEQRTEIFVIDVEVVMVDVDRLVPFELEPSVHLFPIERLGLLLGYPDKDNCIPHWPLLAEVVGDVVFPFFVFELVNRYVFPVRQRLHGLAESLRHLSQHHWRWNRLAQLVAHEHRQLGSGCQPADIAVEVETVEALHFQRDVPIKEFRDGCHSRILRQSWAVCSWV